MSLLSHVASYIVRPKIQHLLLHLTDKCNLRCRHCFVNLRQTNAIPVSKAKELAKDLGSILWLDISGGEPFILDELPELITPFDCDFLQIPTNGHYPETIAAMVPKILRTTRAHETIISVSIEGFREEHQRIRRNKENFDLAFESLSILRRIADGNPHLRVKCNTVITNEQPLCRCNCIIQQVGRRFRVDRPVVEDPSARPDDVLCTGLLAELTLGV